MSITHSTRPTSVYVHFPWCARKCPYCDFATQPSEPAAIPSMAYADAVRRELEWRGPALSTVPRELVSIFFGGGTPSLWDSAAIEQTLQAIEASFESVSDSLEVTAECNPSSLDPQKLNELRDAGINRMSIGIQSLRDPHLEFLGRLHDGAGAIRAASQAREVFDRMSADLMFGMPGHTTPELDEDIRRLVDLGAEHLSVYALTIEPGTPFGAQHRAGRLRVQTDDGYAELYEQAEQTLGELGFAHYEVSNYAKGGSISEHNAHYWRGGEYVGLGAAAVGCLDGDAGHARRWKNRLNPARYQNAQSVAEVELEHESLGPEEIVGEQLMLGLRTAEGVDLRAVGARAGVELTAGRETRIDEACKRGNLVQRSKTLRVPHSRWLKLDGIVRDLF